MLKRCLRFIQSARSSFTHFIFTTRFTVAILTISLISVISTWANSANAATYYWNGATDSGGLPWAANASWFNNPEGDDPATSFPGANDIAHFNISSATSGSTTPNLEGTRFALGLVYESTSIINIRGGAVNGTLVLGGAGITATGTSGNITVGTSTNNATTNNVLMGVAADQDWVNNKSSGQLIFRGGIIPVGGNRTLTLSGSSTSSGNEIRSTFGTGFNRTIRDDSGFTLAIEKSGTGTWRITNGATASLQNTYSGGTTIKAGTLDINSGNSLPASPGTVTSGPLGIGLVKISSDGATNGAKLLAGADANTNHLGNNIELGTVVSGAGNIIERTSTGLTIFSGAVSGSGGFTKTGSGSIALSNANTFSGNTTVSAGTLGVVNELALQNSTVSTITGGIAFSDLVVGNAFTFGGLSGSGNIALQNIAGSPQPIALSIGNNDAPTNYSGNLSAGGSVIKTGDGVTTFLGSNTYGGTTQINGGKLRINGTHMGGDTYTVGENGILGGTGRIDADVVVNGTFAPGGSIESFETGALTLNDNTTFEYEIDLGDNFADLSVVDGNFTIGTGVDLDLTQTGSAFALGEKIAVVNYSGDLTGEFDGLADGATIDTGINIWQINYGVTSDAGLLNFTGDYLDDSSFITLTVVPEPSGFILVGIGLVGLGAFRHRRLKS